ncbi:hypothetical protein [Natrialba aegyptia]|uniref:hypothetical protein n=1 Tax=Natrialba aegyptia TaxID=129789 RepID=UPI000A7F2A33|nr:hypothetical protein [Natrialba aegyptia]
MELRPGDSTHEYNIHAERRVEIEPDRLKEWVDAEDYVYIRETRRCHTLSW